ncbi:MAG TPA: CsgG/HfaB family protein [Gemmatimonadaceae bacterium]|nr:CsgG/HfaB family protein [Gemmatimonadaceae bacterium]
MRARTSTKVWIAAAALVATPIVSFAQANSPVVAVLYFDNNSFGKDRADFDGLGKGIADLLITDMASNPAMRIVERDRIQSILQEQSLVQSKSIDPQTAVRLGKLLGAQYMITGGFMSDSKGTLLVTSRVISVETGAITNPVKLQSKSDDVLGLIGQLSSKLNTELKLPAPVRTGEAEQKKPASVGDAQATKQAGRQAATTQVAQNASAKSKKLDVKTALLYSKALDEQDSGNRQKAAELYRAVLEKFPDFGPAQQNLAKVQKSGH